MGQSRSHRLMGIALVALFGTAACTTGNDVTVVNTPQNPARVRDVDHPARQPFQSQVELSNAVSPTPTIIAFPVGKRLVVEFLSAWCTGTPGVSMTNLRVVTSITTAGTSAAEHHFAPTIFPFGSGTAAVITQPTRVYADGAQLNLVVFPTTNAATIMCKVSVSGYLVTP